MDIMNITVCVNLFFLATSSWWFCVDTGQTTTSFYLVDTCFSSTPNKNYVKVLTYRGSSYLSWHQPLTANTLQSTGCKRFTFCQDLHQNRCLHRVSYFQKLNVALHVNMSVKSGNVIWKTRWDTGWL